MTEKNFSIKEVISGGWQAMKKNFWFFVLFLIVTCTIEGVSSSFSDSKNDLTMNIAGLIGLFVSTLVSLLATKIALDATHDKKLSIDSLKGVLEHYWNFLIVTILMGLIVLGGFILLIVPGFIWAIQFSMAPYLIIDKKMSIMEALKESSKMTHGKKWQLFAFGLNLIGINILGVLALGIGLFATVPTSMVADALVYEKLKK